MPMTACTLPGTAGSRASRRVNGGGSFAVRVELSFPSRTGCRDMARRMSDQVSVCQGHLRQNPDFPEGNLVLSGFQAGEDGLELPRQPLDRGPAEEAVVVSGQDGPVEAGRDEPAPGVEHGGAGGGGRLGNPEGEAAGVGLWRVGAARLEVGGEGGEERVGVSTLGDGASAAGGGVSEPMGWA